MIAFKKHATPNVFSLFISFGNKWKVTEIYFKPLHVNFNQRFFHPEMTYNGAENFLKRTHYKIFSKREVLLFLKKIELRVFGL